MVRGPGLQGFQLSVTWVIIHPEACHMVSWWIAAMWQPKLWRFLRMWLRICRTVMKCMLKGEASAFIPCVKTSELSAACFLVNWRWSSRRDRTVRQTWIANEVLWACSSVSVFAIFLFKGGCGGTPFISALLERPPADHPVQASPWKRSSFNASAWDFRRV